MSLRNLLELRKKIKSKKPAFVRPESHKRIKLGKSWRRPRGLHSKVRLRLKGYHRYVAIGYGSPKETRHLHKSGLKMILVRSERDIEKIDKEKESAIIAKTVGVRKKIDLLKKLKEKNIKVTNVKDVDAYIKEFEEKQRKKAEEKKKKEKEKKKTKEKPKEKLEEKALTEEEKKAEEKKEKDKLLAKKV